jgi:bifunctional enzyme CysN/CysC
MANLLGKALYERGKHVYLLDGDNLRHGLNRDLGFSVEDRSENIRRASEAAHLMADAGLIVLASFISPLRRDRLALRELFREDELYEIFVDTPLEVCIQRDPKNLYAKAMRGEIPDFTGISSTFEVPLEPHLRLDGTKPPDILLEQLLRFASEKVRYKKPRTEDAE